MKLFEIKGQTPNWVLTEAKNVHMEHLEDLVFNQGYDGALSALNYVESVRHMLAQGTGTTSKITVKWDGSPAIICGTDPADGKFFVGTKAVFSQEPKLCKRSSDIEKYYADKPELAEKLAAALLYLRKLNIGTVLQGDLMFTPGDVETAEIKGEQCYVFTPNTITYAVPVDSEIGKRIGQAKLGIVFHTTYEGDSISDMKAQFGAKITGLEKNPNVWFDDATYKDYTGVATLTPSENSAIKSHMSATFKTMQKIGKAKFDSVIENKEFAKHIKPFVNQMVRSGTQVGEPITFLKKFMEFYNKKMLDDIDKLKSGPAGPAAQARLEKIRQKEQWMEKNSNVLLGVLAVYKRIIELKNKVIAKLSRVEGIGTFQKTNDGYKVTSPEGFVAIGHDGGAVKLVDRLEFSRQNFLGKSQ